MDQIVFLPHALEQMQSDSLTEDDVYTVLGDYDDMVERHDGRTMFGQAPQSDLNESFIHESSTL